MENNSLTGNLKQEEKDKLYLLSSLEKKISNFDIYYKMSSRDVQKKFINETSEILKDLRSVKLEEPEKNILRKAIEVLNFLRNKLE